ncbi:MAG: carbohydrate kinase [Lentimicrobium sp.]|nr:carbohydrate kinase [Lentimicrobium sp.]
MVYAIGESLYDLTFKNHHQVWACPGGSMLNSSVSLARRSVPVRFFSEIGNDHTGRLILDFLKTNHINADSVHKYEGKTSLALAFLDAKGDADYEFYIHRPESPADFDLPVVNPGDLMLFGSNYARQHRNHKNILKLARQTKAGGGFLVYDPNFRKIAGNRDEITNLMIENISLSDIVRGSDQDFTNLFGLTSGNDVYQKILSFGTEILIYTRNSEGVDLFTPWFKKHYQAIEIQVVSTVGAGDNFNAGLVSVLHGINKIPESEKFWDQAIHQAIIFASEVCTSSNNFVDWPETD